MINRRKFLRQLGLLGALPLLPSLRARGQTRTPTVFPRRLLVLVHPNGTMPEWWPTDVQSEAQFRLGEIHQPLAAHQAQLLLLGGIDQQIFQVGPGEPHQKGMGGILTGRSLLEGDFVGGDGSLAGWGSGISVDQRLAQVIGQNTALSSLQLGVRASTAEVRSRVSYLGPGQPLPPINDPREVFELLYGRMPGPVSGDDDSSAKRRSVLESVRAQFGTLERRLSAVDREKFAGHLALVEDLERRLSVPRTEACALPPEPPRLATDDEVTMAAITDLQLDLVAAAFACDATRVVTLQMSNAQNLIRYPWVESFGLGHSLSHSGPGDSNARSELVRRERWVAERLARFIGQLAQIDEEGESLLDHTLIVWTSEIAVGNVHSGTNMPFLLAGGGAGFKNGRYVRFPSVSHNRLWLSVLQAFGAPDAEFGDPNFCVGGPLSGLT